MQEIVLNGKITKVSDFLDGFLITATPQSNNIRLFAINPNKEKLFIVFKNGGQYLYEGVSTLIMVYMSNAESVGKFHASEIKPIYDSVKITDVIFTDVVAETPEIVKPEAPVLTRRKLL